MTGENDVEQGKRWKDQPSEITASITRRSRSVFQFKNISYVVGKNNKTKKILDNVGTTLKAGETMAIMGPSGAGKTSLLNVLTLQAKGGVASGSILLNGVPLTQRMFEEECFIVQQEDHHWPFLTCRENLLYAAQLYLGNGNHEEVIDDIITRTGLDICKDTRVGNELFQGLSGGQKRRLSVAIALIKKPSVLFLDEPTSGLDAASADAIMRELRDLATRENLIVIVTIHQPSGKIYNSFNQMMILSRGREAYTGLASEAASYFESLGYEMEKNTNPAEFILDLVNADFTSEEDVQKILDSWVDRKENESDSSRFMLQRQPSFYSLSKSSMSKEVAVMFRRHGLLVIRDPMLYLGRAMIFLLGNIFFAFVYWEARYRDQAQALNLVFVLIWFVGVPCNMGVIAVYALNSENNSISKEIKNGMVKPISYILAKTIITIPIMFLFGAFALAISGYVIQSFHWPSIGYTILFYGISYYPWECMAEWLSVTFRDPLLGMMNYMMLWFSGFLFGGVFLAERDMVWPLKAFFHVFPLRYSIPALVHAIAIDDKWDSCNPAENPRQPVCIDFSQSDNNGKSGAQVLDAIGDVYPLFGSKNRNWEYMGYVLIIALVFKVAYFLVFWTQCSNATKIVDVEGEKEKEEEEEKKEAAQPIPE